jgi:6,7-dimethyl-8-ribityllumazine synthase
MSDWKRSATTASTRESANGPRVVQGKPDAREYRVAIAASIFNDSIVAGLLEGAVTAWSRHGGAVENLLIVRVPGAFELPIIARQLARSGDYDAIVALGCVIRGDTPHFEYVAGECARGLQQVSCDTGIPVSFGVLTVETPTQAQERASPAAGNKGGEAMEVALEMADLLAKLQR